MEKGDFSRKRKEIGIISVAAIIISSFILFFYQQNITEQTSPVVKQLLPNNKKVINKSKISKRSKVKRV